MNGPLLTLDTLLEHPKEFINLFSQCYPLSKRLLEQYKDKWDWWRISWNKNIIWDENLLEQLKSNLNWKTLSNNTSIPWDENFLERFENKWDWGSISSNETIPWSPTLMLKFKKNIKWTLLARVIAKNYSPINHYNIYESFFTYGSNKEKKTSSLPHYKNIASFLFDSPIKELFQYMPKVDFSHQLDMEKFAEQLSQEGWRWLSIYEGFPWTKEFIRKHSNNLEWNFLSENINLPWDMEFIKEHENKWNWKNLSKNEGLPWSKELLEKYKDKWDWESLGRKRLHKTKKDIWIDDYIIPWDDILISTFADNIYWGSIIWQDGGFECLSGLINHPSIKWTSILYKKCNNAIIKFFKLLQKEKQFYLDNAETNLFFYWNTDCKLNWTYYQSWSNWEGKANWSVDYLKMLIQQKKENPDIEYINWDMVSFSIEFFNNIELIEFMEVCEDINLIKECFTSGNIYFFEKYVERFLNNEYCWRILSRSNHFPFDETLLKKYESLWDWQSLASNKSLPANIIEQFAYKWREKSDWYFLSQNPNLTPSLIIQFEEKWNWRELQENPCLTPEIIIKYKNKWEWFTIMRKHHHKLSIDVLSQTNNTTYWELIFHQTKNIKEIISEELLEKFLIAFDTK